jgi:hypothetical protein
MRQPGEGDEAAASIRLQAGDEPLPEPATLCRCAVFVFGKVAYQGRQDYIFVTSSLLQEVLLPPSRYKACRTNDALPRWSRSTTEAAMISDPNKPTQTPVDPGRAVDDEDPHHSPLAPGKMPTGPAQPFDVEHVESDRAKSQGPRLGEGSS